MCVDVLLWDQLLLWLPSFSFQCPCSTRDSDRICEDGNTQWDLHADHISLHLVCDSLVSWGTWAKREEEREWLGKSRWQVVKEVVLTAVTRTLCINLLPQQWVTKSQYEAGCKPPLSGCCLLLKHNMYWSFTHTNNGLKQAFYTKGDSWQEH